MPWHPYRVLVMLTCSNMEQPRDLRVHAMGLLRTLQSIAARLGNHFRNIESDRLQAEKALVTNELEDWLKSWRGLQSLQPATSYTPVPERKDTGLIGAMSFQCQTVTNYFAKDSKGKSGKGYHNHWLGGQKGGWKGRGRQHPPAKDIWPNQKRSCQQDWNGKGTCNKPIDIDIDGKAPKKPKVSNDPHIPDCKLQGGDGPQMEPSGEDAVEALPILPIGIEAQVQSQLCSLHSHLFCQVPTCEPDGPTRPTEDPENQKPMSEVNLDHLKRLIERLENLERTVKPTTSSIFEEPFIGPPPGVCLTSLRDNPASNFHERSSSDHTFCRIDTLVVLLLCYIGQQEVHTSVHQCWC